MLRRMKACRYHAEKTMMPIKLYIKRGRYIKKAIVNKNLLNNYLRIRTQIVVEIDSISNEDNNT